MNKIFIKEYTCMTNCFYTIQTCSCLQFKNWVVPGLIHVHVSGL